MPWPSAPAERAWAGRVGHGQLERASGRTRSRPLRSRRHAGRRSSAPPGGSGRPPGRDPARAAAASRAPGCRSRARGPRWRSASVSSAARPGGGSTRSPAPLGPSSSRSARTSWSISPSVSRATSSIVSSAACERSGSCVLQQPGGTGLDEDDVDRVAGGVVEVARDAGALLGRGQPALALGVPLGATGALLELGDPRAPLADAVADHPGAAPDDRAEEQRHRREARPRRRQPRQTWTTKRPTTTPPISPSRRPRTLGAQSARKKRAIVGPSGGPERVADGVERRAGCCRHDEDRKRRAAPGGEGQRGERGEQHAERRRGCGCPQSPRAASSASDAANTTTASTASSTASPWLRHGRLVDAVSTVTSSRA